MTFPGDYNRRCKITINSAKIPSGTHAGVLVWLGNGWTPSEMRDADGSYPCQTNGADIRAALDSAGTTQVPVYASRISLDNNPVNSNVSIFLRLPEVVSGSDFDFWIFYNSSETETAPAVGSAYGRNNVFQDYVWFYDMENVPPSPYNGVTTDAMTNLEGTAAYNGDTHTWLSGADSNHFTHAEASRMPGKRKWVANVDDSSEEGRLNPTLHSGSGSDIYLKTVSIEAVVTPYSASPEDVAIYDAAGDDGSWIFGFTSAGTTYKWGSNDSAQTVASGKAQGVVRYVAWTCGRGQWIHEDGSQILNDWAMFRAGGNTSPMAIWHKSNDDISRCGEMDVELIGIRIGEIGNNRATFNYRLFYGDTGTLTVGTPENFETTVTLTVTVKDTGGSVIEGAQVYLQKATPTAYTSGAGNSAGDGDLVVTQTIDSDQPQTGMVIIYDRSEDTVMSHRYASHSGSTFTFPTEVTYDCTGGGTSTLLQDSVNNFTTLDIEEGDLVRNTTDGSWALVDEITHASNITTTPLQGGSDNTWTSGDTYSFHKLAVNLVSGTDTVDVPLMNQATNASGIATRSYPYGSETAVDIQVWHTDAATKYKMNTASGTITANGLDVTVILQEDTVIA
jgi:hypothetical protein